MSRRRKKSAKTRPPPTRLSVSIRGPDPFARRSRIRVSYILLLMVGAALAHVVIGGAIAGTSLLLGGSTQVSTSRPVRVKVVHIPPKVPKLPIAAALPEPANPTPEPPSPKPPPKKVVKKKPPAPLAKPRPQPKEPPRKPPRRIAGINFESTSIGGSGATYATGNTRAGKTETLAADPKQVPKATGEAPVAAGTNRQAAHIPGQGFEKPKRKKRVRPAYPATLRAQGIEGTVVVEVVISAGGAVTGARVVRGASHKEFDRAALAAAQKERFSPAKRNGTAIEYRIRFAYRFRLND